MKIKKNIAISLIKDLIQDDKFKKEIIDLISSTSDSSGVAKLEEKKIFNNLLKVHKKTVDDVMVPRGEIIFIDEKIDNKPEDSEPKRKLTVKELLEQRKQKNSNKRKVKD